MADVYELRTMEGIHTELKGFSYSRELILQLAIDMFNLQKINYFYLISPKSKYYIHLDFFEESKGHSIDMVKYQKEQKERVGKIE